MNQCGSENITGTQKMKWRKKEMNTSSSLVCLLVQHSFSDNSNFTGIIFIATKLTFVFGKPHPVLTRGRLILWPARSHLLSP
jgi:hypothetical protein